MAIKIGILGDIGSGKSYVARQFGYPVFSADKEVKFIYKKNKNCFKKLRKILPKFIKSFPISKKELSKAIIDNKKNIKKIEKIVHPIVQKNISKFVKKNKKKKLLIFDIPLLLENKKFNNKYVLIYVDANRKDIGKEIKKRRNYNPVLYNKLKKAQLPLEIKKKRSNFIIKNDFKSLTVTKNVNMIKNKILKK